MAEDVPQKREIAPLKPSLFTLSLYRSPVWFTDPVHAAQLMGLHQQSAKKITNFIRLRPIFGFFNMYNEPHFKQAALQIYLLE